MTLNSLIMITDLRKQIKLHKTLVDEAIIQEGHFIAVAVRKDDTLSTILTVAVRKDAHSHNSYYCGFKKGWTISSLLT